MTHTSGQVRVWVAADWYWHLPDIGFQVGANVKGGDCARWFKIEVYLLFLWLRLHIDGREPERDGEDEDI